MTTLSGECLCGAINYHCTEAPVIAGHCQCTDCQKMSGTGHSSNMAVPRGGLTIQGRMAFHEQKAESGNIVKRGFCPQCGSHIYAENSGMPHFEFIRAGSLHDIEKFKPTMVVYTSSGAQWDHIDPTLTAFETMPKM